VSDTVVVIGEALMDCVVGSSGKPLHEVPGGSPMNVAIGLGRLGHSAVLAARVGSDSRGEIIASHVKASGVALIEASSGLDYTSTATAHLADDGSASYEFDLVWDLEPSMVPEAPYLHVHAGSIACTLQPGASAVREIVQRSRAAGASISYDPNVRPHIMGSAEEVLPQIEALIALSDLVKASDEDAAWLYPGLSLDEVAGRWQELGATLVVITQGAEGATTWSANRTLSLPTHATTVVDTIGAGDTVMAGLIAALAARSLLGASGAKRWENLSENDLAEVVTFALRAAAITVSRAGADLPTLADMKGVI
jgi:fructokinase